MKRGKTYFAKKEKIERKWYLIDATDKILGRLSSQIAILLRGKNKPFFTPSVDCGDYVVVVNAQKVRVTGKKEKDKFYFTHSGYPRGDKLISLGKMRESYPQRIIKLAVWGMLPKGRLGRKIFKKLKVYAGESHPHGAQKLEKIEV